jgi:hypothetical protein
VFQIPKAGAEVWKSLKLFKKEKATTYTICAELAALMDSFYGPRMPLEEIKIPENEYIRKSQCKPSLIVNDLISVFLVIAFRTSPEGT